MSDTQSVPFSASVLDRYLAGEASPADQEAVERWMQENPAARRIVQTPERRGWDTDNAVHRMAQRIAEDRGATATRRVMPERSRTTWWPLLGGAAVVMAGFVVIGLGTGRDRAVSSEHRYATLPGQVAEIVHADGSQTMLAPGSVLQYRRSSSGERTVTLDGEAYFTVSQSAQRGFSVETQGVVTTVLGTAFNVRRYTSDSVTQVDVTSGKVNVRVGTAATTLIPGDVASASDSAINVSRGNTPGNASAWTRGELVFRDAPILTVLETISRWYGYKLKLADSTLATRHVTFVVSTSRPFGTALRYLEDLLDVRVTIRDNTAILHPRRPEERKPSLAPAKIPQLQSLPAFSEMGR